MRILCSIHAVPAKEFLRLLALLRGTSPPARAFASGLEAPNERHDPDLDDALARIREEAMLRAEDIAVGIHYMLTQPRRAVVRQLVIVPRDQAKE